MNDECPDRPEIDGNDGSEITTDAVWHAINLAKSKKAIKPDEIPAKILKTMGENCIRTLTSLFNNRYNYGIISDDDRLKSIFVTTQKKPNAKSFETQFGFQNGSGTCKILSDTTLQRR